MNSLLAGINNVLGSQSTQPSNGASVNPNSQTEDQRLEIGTTFLSKFGSIETNWLMLQDTHATGAKTIAFAQLADDKLSQVESMFSELKLTLEGNDQEAATNQMVAIQDFIEANVSFLPRLYMSEGNGTSPQSDSKTVADFFEVLDLQNDELVVEGKLATFEVDMQDVFNSYHRPDSCPICQQNSLEIEDQRNATSTTVAGSDTGSSSYTSGSGDGTRGVNALAGGSKWSLDADETLTFSLYVGDGSDSHWDYSAMSSENTVHATAFALTDAQQTASRAAFNAWDDIAGFTLEEIIEDFDTDTVGEIRVANASTSHDSFGGTGVGGIQAYAYYPGSRSNSGDIWIGDPSDRTLNALTDVGRLGYDTISHEFGHAIGIKHPQDGTNNISGADDDTNRYSIMSYGQNAIYDRNAIIDSDGSIARLTPSTPMIYDIAVAQWLYGEETTANTGNTTYSFTDGEVFIKSIHDAGGTDTLDASSQSTRSIIDLTPGSLSSIGLRTVDEMYAYWGAQDNGRSTSSVQSYFEINESSLDGNSIFGTSDGSLDSNGGMYLGQENFGIGVNATIENAKGGAGDDTITGNTADNEITGNGGDDTIDGGDGTDTVIFTGNLADYTIAASGSGYTVTDSESNRDGTDTVSNVEVLKFADTNYSLTLGSAVSASGTVSNTSTGSSTFTEVLMVGSGSQKTDNNTSTGSAQFTEVIAKGSDKASSGGSYFTAAIGGLGSALSGPHGMGSFGLLGLFGAASGKALSSVESSVSQMRSNLTGIQQVISNRQLSNLATTADTTNGADNTQKIIKSLINNPSLARQLSGNVSAAYTEQLLNG